MIADHIFPQSETPKAKKAVLLLPAKNVPQERIKAIHDRLLRLSDIEVFKWHAEIDYDDYDMIILVLESAEELRVRENYQKKPNGFVYIPIVGKGLFTAVEENIEASKILIELEDRYVLIQVDDFSELKPNDYTRYGGLELDYNNAKLVYKRTSSDVAISGNKRNLLLLRKRRKS